MTATTVSLLSYPASVEAEREFDNDRADRYEWFFPELLTITEGDAYGEPLELAPEPWLPAIRECFGWRWKKNGRRWYRTLYIYIPRKNAKTTTIAGLVLAIPIIEPEARGQILIVAATEDQAKILFNHSLAFIEASPDLQELYYAGAEEIVHVETGTVIKFLSGAELGKVGSNPSVIIVDELQEQTNSKVLNKLITGRGTRKQPLTILIGTRGKEDDTQENVFWVKWLRKAEETLKNPSKNKHLLPIVYQTEEDADPSDPNVWLAANPTLGTIIDMQSFADIYDDMKDDPEQLQEFCQYNLNMKRNAFSEALDLVRWNELACDIDIKKLKGKHCFGGLDLGLSSDMCGFTLLFPHWEKVKYKDERGKMQEAMHPTFDQLEWYWTCEDAIKAADKTVFKLSPLVEAGWVRKAGTSRVDFNQIGSEILNICKQFDVEAIGYDRFQAHEMAPRLAAKRIKMVIVSQNSLNMSSAYVRHRDMVRNGDIRHRDNPMFVENLRAARVGYDKKQNPFILKIDVKRKIDGYAAALDAVRVFMDTPPKYRINV